MNYRIVKNCSCGCNFVLHEDKFLIKAIFYFLKYVHLAWKEKTFVGVELKMEK